MSNQRSQQTKTYHHVHLRVALRWLWTNSVRHLMMRTRCFSRHPFRSLTHMQQLCSPNTRIFLSFCYKAHSHQIAMMSISYVDEPTPAIFRYAKKTPVRVCATTFFSHVIATFIYAIITLPKRPLESHKHVNMNA